MITHKISIEVKNSPIEVYDYIDNVYNKFPLHPFFDSKPIFFVRLLILDGYKSAKKMMSNNVGVSGKLSIGDAMGPFKVLSLNKPDKYFFALQSMIFTCETGYEIESLNEGSLLSFSLYAESRNLKQKIVWLLLKPFHSLFASQVLNNIKMHLSKQYH
jgi:hypothetical protein